MEICPKAEAAGEINPVADEIITGLTQNVGKNLGQENAYLEYRSESNTYKAIVITY
jgi:hypothetical protein